MKLIRFEDVAAVPWKNGGGTTRELAVHPPGAGFADFHWRVSVADVGESGPFSAFPGIERIILLLDGDGMDLRFDGGLHALTQPLVPFRFRGEDEVHARLAGSASRDFNFMFRRDIVEGQLAVWREARSIDCTADDSFLLFCAVGRWDVALPGGARHEIGARDTLTGECPAGRIEAVPLEPGSALIAIQATHQSQAGEHHAKRH